MKAAGENRRPFFCREVASDRGLSAGEHRHADL